MTASRFPGYPLLRLAWRPATLIFAFPLTLFLTIALSRTGAGADELFPAVRHGVATFQLRTTLWVISIGISGLAGAGAGMMMREAISSSSAWMLPRYVKSLAHPLEALAVTLAILGSLPLFRVTSSAEPVATFGVSLLAFAAGWTIFDPQSRNLTRAAAALFLIGMIYRPTPLVLLGESYPLYLAAFAIAFAWLTIDRLLTKEVSRERALSPASGSMIPPKYLEHKGASTFRGRVIVSQFALYRAGLYESFGGRWGRTGDLVMMAIVWSVSGFVTKTPGQMIMIAFFSIGFVGTQLKNAFAYPISRRRRATAFFVASVVDTLAACSVAALAVLTITLLGLWRVDPESTRLTPLQTLETILVLVLLAPIAQAAMVPGWVVSKKIQSRRQIVALVGLIITIGFTYVLQRIFFESFLRSWAVMFVATLFIVYSAFWTFLRWYFKKKDLP